MRRTGAALGNWAGRYYKTYRISFRFAGLGLLESCGRSRSFEEKNLGLASKPTILTPWYIQDNILGSAMAEKGISFILYFELVIYIHAIPRPFFSLSSVPSSVLWLCFMGGKKSPFIFLHVRYSPLILTYSCTCRTHISKKIRAFAAFEQIIEWTHIAEVARPVLCAF